MRTVKVLIWGFGAMGSGMARMLLKKQGVEIVGVCDTHVDRMNKNFKDLIDCNSNEHPDVFIEKDIDLILRNSNADVALLATDSFTEKAYDKLVKLMEAGLNVICTAEQMAYPYANSPDLAASLDEIAKKNNVSVLGTGVNPGMIMDLLVICLTGCMEEVEHISAKRVNSLSPFGYAVMEEQGVGLSLEEYNELASQDKLAGHVGFKESVMMISEGLGLGIDRFEQQMEPIISDVDLRSEFGFAPANHVAGINMSAQGFVGDKLMVEMEHPQQIEPHLANISTGDYIKLEGKPCINMAITPEVEGGIGTIAMCVNMIPHIINASPGLKTMLDLPVPRAIMSDMSKLINWDKYHD